MAQIIRSLIYLIVISSSAGGVYYFFHPTLLSFIKATILTAAIQILFFILYNILRYIARIQLEKEALLAAQLAAKNKVLLECSGCKKTNNVDIDLAEENSFTCSCGAENKVVIDITSILPTNIIYDK